MDSYIKYIKKALVIIIYKLKKKLILERTVKLYSTNKSNTYKIIKISKKNHIVSKIRIG